MKSSERRDRQLNTSFEDLVRTTLLPPDLDMWHESRSVKGKGKDERVIVTYSVSHTDSDHKIRLDPYLRALIRTDVVVTDTEHTSAQAIIKLCQISESSLRYKSFQDYTALMFSINDSGAIKFFQIDRKVGFLPLGSARRIDRHPSPYFYLSTTVKPRTVGCLTVFFDQKTKPWEIRYRFPENYRNDWPDSTFAIYEPDIQYSLFPLSGITHCRIDGQRVLKSLETGADSVLSYQAGTLFPDRTIKQKEEQTDLQEWFTKLSTVIEYLLPEYPILPVNTLEGRLNNFARTRLRQSVKKETG
jgi:hypothetical protein